MGGDGWGSLGMGVAEGIGGDKEGEPNPHPVALCFPDTKKSKRQLHSTVLRLGYFRAFFSPMQKSPEIIIG